jgi:hypothetical protein
MSGPIRPGPAEVLDVIHTMRRQLPGAEFFLCTWVGQSTPAIRKAVDHVLEIPEPTEAEIDAKVHARTTQQREAGDVLKHWVYSMYRMVHGVRSLCDSLVGYLKPDDIVIRIRTDTPFYFTGTYLVDVLNNVGQEYIVRNRISSAFEFDDWFAITRFSILRETWTFEDYNASVNAAWNAEQLIRNNLRCPIRYLDKSRVHCYINRPNGKTEYHP